MCRKRTAKDWIMRILMLGWEFPPFIAGGLGTACAGLTKSMVAQGHEITFVFPQPIPVGHQSHVNLIGPRILKERIAKVRAAGQGTDTEILTTATTTSRIVSRHTTPDTIERSEERRVGKEC